MGSQKIFTEQIIDYLTSPDGLRALDIAKTLDLSKVSDIAKLRKICPAELSRAVIELKELRKRAREKFSRADEMIFDRQGYEQASGEDVAEYKAKRFRKLIGRKVIADLCCGIGGDTIVLAADGQVVACDISIERIRMTEINLKVYHCLDNCKLLCGDVTKLDFENAVAFHIDPDRRSTKKRIVSIEQMQPGVDFIDRLIKQIPDGAIKLSPACDYEHLPWAGEIELISSRNQCRQIVLWTGRLASVGKRATSITSGQSIDDAMPARYNVSGISNYLYDPDPACSRLKLLGQLAGIGGLDFLAPGQIVLTCDEPKDVPLAKVYKVIETMPYREDKLIKYFKSNPARVTVKPRGVDVNVDKLSRRLSSQSGQERFLFLLRIDKKVLAVVTEQSS